MKSYIGIFTISTEEYLGRWETAIGNEELNNWHIVKYYKNKTEAEKGHEEYLSKTEDEIEREIKYL